MDLKNKKIVVLGLANKRSIAWGILQNLKARGATIGICYFHQSNLKRVKPLAEEIEADFYIEADVTKTEEIENLHNVIKEKWGTFDGLVHSIAFSPSEEFNKRFHECSKKGFFETLDISAFSLVSLCQVLKPLFSNNFSIISMTYYGSKKVLPGYNLMGVAKAALESITMYLAHDLGRDGIRVNAISAGPIKTLAAVGIPNFSTFLDNIKDHSPLKKNVTIQDVGNLASFLLSDNSSSITGQVHYVDAGISIVTK
ncbi:enoyl-ACP reductase [Halobacteriovorax marinus]|uniref:Enoyl-[acyl-carrier-protein] reductase [NADH] n=1 Tax=Halobacteriovorax marinus TaxID=97084 RepID=A0A1Y5FC05_9BACT|nr:enoyl-ACP reductase [Halobacteriovorax marinus]